MQDTRSVNTYELVRGDTPLIISIPHGGERIPESIKPLFNPVALQRDDTDWHLGLLYAFAREMGASVIQARYSRYVIDLNRPADDSSLYPGQTTTGLVPTETFDGQPLYQSGFTLSAAEKNARLNTYWRPYHQALQTQIELVRQQHGYALLWDAHSIRSQIPRLFDGVLPDFNIGTNADQSAPATLAEQLAQMVHAGSAYSAVANQRFKGGYITRHYGCPHQKVYAIQLELAQKTYMLEKPPYTYEATQAAQVAVIIKRLITHALSTLQLIHQKD